MANPFLEGTFPEQGTILENAHCVFVMTPQPVFPGSGLIVTKEIRETVFNLTPEEWTATFELLREAKLYLDDFRPDGYNIGWNVRPVGGQSVPHVHLHVIPRNDGPRAGKGVRYYLQPEDRRS